MLSEAKHDTMLPMLGVKNHNVAATSLNLMLTRPVPRPGHPLLSYRS